jgi:hypothetical protein
MPSAVQDDRTVAFHEAGHLAVGLIVRRTILKVSIDLVDGKRGCFWKKPETEEEEENGWDVFSDFCCLLAGPRAQITLVPSSLPTEKLSVFAQRIVQPAENRFQPSMKPYDHTGWQHDMEAVYNHLTLPDAPADVSNLRSPTRLQALDRAEAVLLNCLSARGVTEAVTQVADGILSARLLTGSAAEELVRSTGLLANDAACSLLH